MAVSFEPGSRDRWSEPQVLFELSEDLHTSISTVAGYDAAPDGRRFLFVRKPRIEPPALLHLIVNWPALSRAGARAEAGR